MGGVKPGRRDKRKQPRKNTLAMAVAAASSIIGMANTAQAFQFDTSPDWAVRWDNTVRYNLGVRTSPIDSKVADKPLFDDATKSFDRGSLITNRLDLITEFDVVWKDRYGFRVSAAAWYDQVYNTSSDHPDSSQTWASPSVEPGKFTDEAKRLHGRDAELLDAFVFGSFDIGSLGLGLRAGRHTLFWGQSLLTSGAIHGVAGAMAPIDAIKAFSVPGSEAQELFMPTTKLSGSLQFSPSLTLNAYYSFEFREHRLPAVGTYWSPSEHYTNDAEFIAAIPGAVATGVRGVDAEEPGQGEWGLGLEWYANALDMDFGFYYIEFNDKLPQGIVANIDGLKFAGVLPADQLSPINQSVGEFKWTYKEKNELYGFSFAKELWGVSFGSDIVYRRNAALNINADAALLERVSLPGSPSGFETLDESNYGGPVGNTYSVVLNAFGFLSSNALWDGGAYIAEFTASMVDNVTENEQLLNANVAENVVATTIAVNIIPEWYQVFPSVDMKLPLKVSYGISNFSPVVLGGAEEVGNASVGASFIYNQVWFFDINYANLFGSINNLATTTDRDFVSFTVKYTF